ncbi:hypothetical protein [Streptomyces pinistramenti]|nr:hypothetical protein [Streptomyces pinistramenti]MCB5911005.1 hypothetical protein [Streptomyces pinistramenti]
MSWWEGALVALALVCLGWFAVGSLVRSLLQTAGSLSETVHRLREMFR